MFLRVLTNTKMSVTTDLPHAPKREVKPVFNHDQYQMDKVTVMIKEAMERKWNSCSLNEEQLRPPVAAKLKELGYKCEWICMRDEAGTVISW
jgi:hypothetical protein